ncbi:unnamed protein product [Mytilus edulis]|uniref:Uncharacterized protein n=1 Tax=Mytilus edulis TaxID=6550 RepID=A0A8S3TXE6_MYTED|nr:unnamed protein product [Mytilus edulis]
MSETDIAKMIAFLSKHGKYKVLTNEEYDLISYAKPLVKKEGKPPPPPSFRKYYHDFSGINEQVKPKVSFNLGNHTHDITGNTPTYQRPRLPVFSGDAKSEASFDVWKFEVKCLLRENLYPELIIVQCMRNSLKNQARNTLLTLPESATPHNILEKLEGIYGNVYSNETLLQSFYTEKQDEVNQWPITKLDAFNKRLDNFEGELKKVKESQGDDQQNRQNNKPQGSGNYWNNRGTQRGRYNDNYRGQTRDLESKCSPNFKSDLSKTKSLLDRMVGMENQSIIQVNSMKCKALIDSGSMISTVSDHVLKLMKPVPEVKDLDDFELSVSVAGG